MTSRRKRSLYLAATLALTVGWSSGCQTYFPDTGQTLPSGRYLDHQPQFIPRSPTFPLSKESYNLEQAANQAAAQQLR